MSTTRCSWTLRRWRAIVYGQLPTLAGLALALGFFALLRPQLNALSLGCAAALTGLGIDFAIHILAPYYHDIGAGQDTRQAIHAASLRILKELGSLNSPSHYDALSFLSSPGSWSPDGRRLAYVVYRRGDQVIDLYDTQTGRTERTVTAPGVGAALDPAWSPDGRYIAFSGMKGGISDLYLYDLTTGTTEQLTTGRNAEIQPAWSPDGRTLAFATDRSDETSFDRLTFGPMAPDPRRVSTTRHGVIGTNIDVDDPVVVE